MADIYYDLRSSICEALDNSVQYTAPYHPRGISMRISPKVNFIFSCQNLNFHFTVTGRIFGRRQWHRYMLFYFCLIRIGVKSSNLQAWVTLAEKRYNEPDSNFPA